MKNLILVLIAAGGLSFLAGCADRDEHEHTSTTTTEETHVRQPVSETTTTETVRPGM
ncbi:MAG TPA: hypothetical protein VG733_19040 [Chthoniobacteraceae bacterium]|nr:hypothetical protein [Chthoniobacteraceae bacterium]